MFLELFIKLAGRYNARKWLRLSGGEKDKNTPPEKTKVFFFIVLGREKEKPNLFLFYIGS